MFSVLNSFVHKLFIYFSLQYVIYSILSNYEQKSTSPTHVWSHGQKSVNATEKYIYILFSEKK